MSVDQRRVIQKAFKHLSTSTINPFTDQRKVEMLLTRAMVSSAVFTLVQEDKPQAVSCLLDEVSTHGLKLRPTMTTPVDISTARHRSSSRFPWTTTPTTERPFSRLWKKTI